jgi:hypothetical protein
VPESRMKTRGLWGEICARVFRPRATEPWQLQSTMVYDALRMH